jgi:lysophospholipase L1-like esterase
MHESKRLSSNIQAAQSPSIAANYTPPAYRKPWGYELLSGIYSSLPTGEGDIYLVGDSHIQNAPWSELLRNQRIKNRGIGGDSTLGLLKRLDSSLGGLPDKIIIMVGVNDINRGYSVAWILENYAKILLRLSKRFAKTDVYVMSVLPYATTRPGYLQNNQKIQSLNEGLKELTAELEYTFIDLHGSLAEGPNLSAKYSYDGLHLNAPGYRLVVNILLEQVMTDAVTHSKI